MEQQIEKLKRDIRQLLKSGEYSMAMECIEFFCANTNANEYIEYMTSRFNWKKYFMIRRIKGKKYGYFVYGKSYRQIVFQWIRPFKWLTKRIFNSTQNQPNEFFYNQFEYEREQLLNDMVPRAREIFEHIENYKNIAEILADKKSQYVYICILIGFLTMQYEFFEMANSNVETDYLPSDIFKRMDLKCIVDCGGYDGDTALGFYKIYKDKIQSYYLIEPDPHNIDVARNRLKRFAQVKYIEAASSNKKGIVSFKTGGVGGKICSGTGYHITVPTVTLDETVNERISFIKMDVEGSELMTLWGGIEHIRVDIPQMSVCAYHKPEDIRELIEFVISMVPSYKVYIRHYSDKYKETVIYFVNE